MEQLGATTRLVNPPQTTLRGRWLLAAKAAWVVATILIVGLSVTAAPVAYTQYQSVCVTGADCLYLQLDTQDVLALQELGLSVNFYAAYKLAVDSLYMLGFWVTGAVIFWKRSDDWLALSFSLMLITFGASDIVDWLVELHPLLGSLGESIAFLGYLLFYVSFFVFPDGRLVPRWGVWPILIWTAYQALLSFSSVDSPLHPKAWSPLLVFPLVLSLFGTVVFAQIYRYRRISGPAERQQTKWVVFGMVAAIILTLAAVLPGAAFPEVLQPGIPKVLYALTETTVTSFSLLLIPLSICVAILRYRLWDIDIIINRTLVYGGLTASVISIYALAVGSLGALLDARGNFAISLLAAGLIAVLFAPLRDRLQRVVNRLMYGERDEPYTVVSRLGQRLEATLAPNAVLPTVVQTVKDALKLPYVAITLREDNDLKVAAEAGKPVAEPLRLPLAYQNEPVGQMLLSPRVGSETFTAAEHQLLTDLARQAGVAAHAVRLTADLQRSRERLVTAREEERRRLRRDLHDGLGPTLAGLTFGLDAARSLLTQNPNDTDVLLAELKAQTQATVADIRRLVYGLRPPALDDLGLVPAIRQQAANHGSISEVLTGGTGKEDRENGLLVFLDAPEQLPSLPAAVEVACYRIAQEATTNVARHARAHNCQIRLSVDDAENALELEVTDDGLGLPEDRRAGVGLSSMRERATELGGSCVVEPVPTGGTRVLARLPLPAADDEEE